MQYVTCYSCIKTGETLIGLLLIVATVAACSRQPAEAIAKQAPHRHFPSDAYIQALIQARAHGGSYEDLVRERIFQPLAMNNTGITLSADMRYWLVKGVGSTGGWPDSFSQKISECCPLLFAVCCLLFAKASIT